MTRFDTSIYLAHSASEKPRGKRIQEMFEKQGIRVFNPFDKQLHIRDAWEGKHNDSFTWTRGLKDEHNKTIVESDLFGIDSTEMTVLIYPDGPTLGIPCEMMYAYTKDKKTYALVPPVYEGHPWVNHMCEVYISGEYGFHCPQDIMHDIMNDRPWLGVKPLHYCDWYGCSQSYQMDPSGCSIAPSGETCHSIHPWDDREIYEDSKGRKVTDEEWKAYLFKEHAYDRYVSAWEAYHS